MQEPLEFNVLQLLFTSALILVIAVVAGRSYHEKLIYKRLFLNQKAINAYNYGYWLDFFTRYGALQEIKQGEKGERTWVILKDPIIFHRREAVYAVEKWIAEGWGDEDVYAQ